MANPETDGGEEVEAVISAVKGEGSRRFAVTYPTRDGPVISQDTVITFTLTAWEGKRAPRRGQVVILTEVERFAKGWRAQRARPIRLDSRKENKQ